VATLRCECPSWTHEACLAKSVFETGGCPTCRKSIDLIDDETVLAKAAADALQLSMLLPPLNAAASSQCCYPLSMLLPPSQCCYSSQCCCPPYVFAWDSLQWTSVLMAGTGR
jgi:hypothetical protein